MEGSPVLLPDMLSHWFRMAWVSESRMRGLQFLFGTWVLLVPALGAQDISTEPPVQTDRPAVFREALRAGEVDLVQEWDRFVGFLDALEGAPASDDSRFKYLALLVEAGTLLRPLDAAMLHEAAFGDYLQKGLRVVTDPQMDGVLRLLLAESLLRRSNMQDALARRAETLLKEAILRLPEESPLEHAHHALGRIYRFWGEAGPHRFPDSPGNLTRAVQHLKQAVSVPGLEASFLREVDRALDALTTPQLEVSVSRRFTPDSALRIDILTRNIGDVQLTFYELPMEHQGIGLSVKEIRELLSRQEDPVSRMVYAETYETGARDVNDWQRMSLTPQVTLPAGWYRVVIANKDIEADSLLLVTPVELAAVETGNGDLLVWVGNVDTGFPLPSIPGGVLDAEGNPLSSFVTGEDGFARVAADQIAGWREIHLHAPHAPGHLRRGAALLDEHPPWVLMHPRFSGGQSRLPWAVIKSEDDGAEGTRLQLPDGEEVALSASGQAAGWATGEIGLQDRRLPEGHVQALLPDGSRFHLAYLEGIEESLMEIRFFGDRLQAGRQVFRAGAPLRLELAVRETGTALPDFLRLRISEVMRRPYSLPGEQDVGLERVRLLHQDLVGFPDRERMVLSYEVPELGSGDAPAAYKVEVYPFNSDQLLAEGWFGIVAAEAVVAFASGEQLINSGEEIEIRYEKLHYADTTDVVIEGHFVINRETWVRRYVHRKRGQEINEEAYLELPDRSLLGAAKTDYRLASQGFEREQVGRVPAELAEASGLFSLMLEDAGFYNIEFQPGTTGVAAHYPDGPLELWVVPGEDSTVDFRSDRPRLIVEPADEGALEVLLLLGNDASTAVLYLDDGSGEPQAMVYQPERRSLYKVFNPAASGEGAGISRALFVGNGVTRWLSAFPVRDTLPDWQLHPVEGFLGLNPGVEFSWEFELGESPPREPLFWTFIESGHFATWRQGLEWQEALHAEKRQRAHNGAHSLSGWLPVQEAQADPNFDRGDEGGQAWSMPRDPRSFSALFPELMKAEEALATADGIGFTRMETAREGQQANLSGSFPLAAGRWELLVFQLGDDQRLRYRNWGVSTELPIQTILMGPETVRTGDAAELLLRMENTTELRETLEAETVEFTGMEWSGFPDTGIALRPFSSRELRIPVRLTKAGERQFRISLKGGRKSSEAMHVFSVGDLLERTAVADIRIFDADEARGGMEFTHRGLAEPQLVMASNIGSLLPALRDLAAAGTRETDPRALALMDWCLRQAFARHGMAGYLPENIGGGDGLPGQLVDSQLPDGGWSWLEDGEADPWLSAFIVWAIQLFDPAPKGDSEAVLEAAYPYLQAVLVDHTIALKDRLMALRAFAVPGLHVQDWRPSRIEARTFLDVFSEREELTRIELCILMQIAKAYGFREEVELLSGQIGDQLLPFPEGEAVDFRTASLLYLALMESPDETKVESLLRHALALAGTEGLRGGWDALAGFLDLGAAFFRDGPFQTTGAVRFILSGKEASVFSLEPHDNPSGYGLYPLGADEATAGSLELELEPVGAPSRLFILLGGQALAEPPQAYPGETTVSMQRQFSEDTLLRGRRLRTEPLPAPALLRQGDTLSVDYQFSNPESVRVVEFRIPMPAGLSFKSASLIHAGEFGEDLILSGDLLQLQPQEISLEDALRVRLRAAPFREGAIVLKVEYEALWAGVYQWPAPEIVYPKSGKAYLLDRDRTLEVTSD